MTVSGRSCESSEPTHCALSRDGRVLAFTVDARVEVWRLSEPLRRLDAVALAPDEEVAVLALSSGGAALAVGTTFGRVWLFTVDVDVPTEVVRRRIRTGVAGSAR